MRLALLFIPLVFACFALSPKAQAVSPPPDGAYPDVGGAAPEVAQRYDFNGDGHPDYVLLNGASNSDLVSKQQHLSKRRFRSESTHFLVVD